MSINETKGLLSFLNASPTCFHAIEAVKDALNGFTELNEHEKWKLEPGKSYYVTRNRSSIIAFTMPEGDFDSFRIVASHSDSPTFKIKENAEITVRDKYVQLDTEPYGGVIFSSWFDRPLSVAGRVIVKTAAGISTRLVKVDRDLLVIPNVAIHMNRDVNNGFKYQANVDTFPLFGTKDAKNTFRAIVAEACGAKVDEIAGCDLFLYNRMPGTVWGTNDEFISAARIDDLECAYTSLRALLTAKPAASHVNVCCVFDNEEVGSTTKQGADSTFMNDVLKRIALCRGKDAENYIAALSGSFMLSADNAHAVHPNHLEYADPVNQVYMNEGIVVKFNANQKYTTDGISEAVFHTVCGAAGVPVQHYTNRSDLAGGGTLGNISGSHVSINTLDIGLAQLAMHSSYETAGTKDIVYMIDGMRAFYDADIHPARDGEYTVSM